MATNRQATQLQQILGLMKQVYKRLGAMWKLSVPEESPRTKYSSEVNWHAVKAALEAEKERERRKWELWAMYGRKTFA